MTDQLIEEIKRFMEEFIPFNKYLNLKAVHLEPGKATLAIPFQDILVGDPWRPALHGGVISMLIDTAGGAAVFSSLELGDRCSTVDLRVDYLRPAPLKPLVAEAEVVRLGNRVGVASIKVRSEGSTEILAEGKGVYNVVRMTKAEREAMLGQSPSGEAPAL